MNQPEKDESVSGQLSACQQILFVFLSILPLETFILLMAEVLNAYTNLI
ncbi:MAG: hypothetical protein SAL70_42370 [Scytonema sp. PMC 1070.18]|nr:hypothetical protein [Scytonema sp. PMC 1070.18]